MSAYYVIAIVIAVGAIVLSAIGLTREDFPPTVRAGRRTIGERWTAAADDRPSGYGAPDAPSRC